MGIPDNKIIMSKTINDFIKELEALKPSLRELPVKIVAPNGLIVEPKVKVLIGENQGFFDKPEKMYITY